MPAVPASEQLTTGVPGVSLTGVKTPCDCIRCAAVKWCDWDHIFLPNQQAADRCDDVEHTLVELLNREKIGKAMQKRQENQFIEDIGALRRRLEAVEKENQELKAKISSLETRTASTERSLARFVGTLVWCPRRASTGVFSSS